MSASFGETTCTRADPGPDVTRWTTHCAGTMTPTRPSTNSVIGMFGGRRANVVSRRESTAERPQPIAACRPIRQSRVRRDWSTDEPQARGPRPRDGSASTLRRTQSRSQIVTATPLARKRSAIAAASGQAPSTPSGPSTTTAIDVGIFANNRFGVSTRHHLDVASGQRHNHELRRDLHYRQRSIRQSVAQHLCPSQHHNVVRHRARGIAHTVHARRCPPRRTNEHDRFGRTADDIVHDGSPHVRDG